MLNFVSTDPLMKKRLKDVQAVEAEETFTSFNRSSDEEETESARTSTQSFSALCSFNRSSDEEETESSGKRGLSMYDAKGFNRSSDEEETERAIWSRLYNRAH